MDRKTLPGAPGHSGLPFADSAAGALLDADGLVIGWTPAAEELLSLPADRVCGRPARKLLADPAGLPGPPGGRPVGAWSGEAVVRTGRGEELTVVFQVLPLAGPGTGAGAEGAGGPARYFVLGAPAGKVARWRQDQAFTRELFLQDRLGLAVFDAELRLVRTNTHLLPYTGLLPDLRNRRLGDFLQAPDAAAIERRLREVLRTGQPLILAEDTVRTIEDPGGGVVMAVSAFRLQAPDGQVFGVTALFTDVTEQRRSDERLAILHHATAAVGGSLSVTGTGEELAAVLVPGLADLAVVEIARAVFTGEEPVPGEDGTVPLRLTAAAGERAEEVPTGTVVPADAGSAPSVGGSPSSMTAPLRARGSFLGRVTVRRGPDRRDYAPADLDLLCEIAARAALALDNARRYTREHRAAVGLQRSLLPPAQAETVAVTTSGFYLPADTATGVGGDWFDVIPLSSARVALVAGDVVGHGLGATATMGRLRTAVRTLADLDLEPDELMVHLDDLVSQLRDEPNQPYEPDQHEGTDQHDGPDRSDGPDRPSPITRPDEDPAPGDLRADPVGATCLYAVYDPVARRCAMVSAGHPPPAVVDPDGTVSYVPLNPGPPLGVNGLPFEVTEVELAPGSLLVLYTDGLIEGRDSDLDEGMAELSRRLARPGAATAPLRELGQEIISARPAHQLADDVTLLLARTHAVPAGNTAVWPVAADPAAVARLRQDAAQQLRAWGLEELVFTTELVLSELVTNAIRHAGGPVEVRLIRAGQLTCEVSDPSATQPRMRRALLTDEGGRGLYLVAQLTTRWGSRYTRRGKTIWAEQPIPDAPGETGDTGAPGDTGAQDVPGVPGVPDARNG
ncbi:SpoIIE family protein phosphatase [Streptomyces sp. NBC_00257]|uniref:SpoIIE family protein phosphatase n=1 Tax=unclassified Streptomyces TaxID=2593676 RepID=UPI00224E4AAB|nr:MULTISPECIES: SpoIIE family protein phosphatase [unclassified Streptomyces]WTB54025.1 SpoIIE family protein phosphatase [Streptomyces sp. NBC_00826]WTH93085.1 SpoIIE family protein phosphatase [Streptomyces sp. NBC_00825]WTI01817.1 SpoIIE family protein phosphatase [Streptomyces sp. NBC_00822]MCX4867438.1 SpoIIE family protein phosphatase [Streptomyces sp. NBC_00906]MCX4898676.1 SpoIIE family protein phosphatase [Streptomyces sp. NBC_00892]